MILFALLAVLSMSPPLGGCEAEQASRELPEPISKAVRLLPRLSESKGDVFGFLRLRPKGDDPVAKEIVGRTGSVWERWAITEADGFVLEIVGHLHTEEPDKFTITEVRIMREIKGPPEQIAPRWEAIHPPWRGSVKFQVPLKSQ